ncbi:hypothetical protein MK280_08680, partial [Myxococcota bacterium]|nr:hypothetical protein [Myxococcota bacterium]
MLQQEILLEALAAFEEIQVPGEIKALSHRWSDDESWRAHPMGGGQREDSDSSEGNDVRTP